MPNYFQTNSGQCVHCKENARQTLENLILPFSLLVLLAIALYTKRKRIKELRRKYGNTLRDMLRIITISFSYAQINSSLPQVLTVPFPTGYLTFLDKLDFVNLDIMGMVGIGCMENVDFRWRVAMVSGVVPLSVLFLYLCRQKELDENASKVVNGLFDSVDVNGSGHIDADEFQTLLVEMNQPETTVDQRIVQMKELGAVGNDRHDVLLPRAAFIDAAENKKLETVLGTHWVRRVAANQARSERWSNTLVLLFLMHAPVSQRLFYYFSCNAVGEKKYLVQDYSIACGENKHSEFAPFVVFMLLFFTFGLPLVVSGLLFAKRKSLYNPKVHAMMGFLYARFKVGSEFWEIHEVVRKCLLMGFLIFLPPTSRSAIAILICVVCCCTLNFFQPHRNKLVLFVSQLSFLMTTFKYVCVVFLRLNDLKQEDAAVMGGIMVMLDVVFLIASFVACVLILVLLRQVSANIQKNPEKGILLSNVHETEQKIKRYNSITRVPSKLLPHKTWRTKQVEKIQQMHSDHRNSFVELVLQNQISASTRLEKRLERRLSKRKNNNNADKTNGLSAPRAVVPIVRQANDPHYYYQKQMKKLAHRILRLRTKKNDKLISCFQHLPPIDQVKVLDQQSLASVLGKLKVADELCERMAKDVITETGRTDSMVTLEEFVGWAQSK